MRFVVTNLKYLKNTSTLELDISKCTGCTMCLIVCPHAVFAMVEKKAKIIDRDACMECGACALNCPDNAITVQSGVGCATALIAASIRGGEPSCGCDDDDTNSCCC